MPRRLLHSLSYPVHALVHGATHLLPPKLRAKVEKHHRHMAHSTIGGLLVMGGAFMATHPADWMPHFLWDATAYFIHGMGAVPIFNTLSHVGVELLREG
jgi:hypothetical protein